MECVSPTADHRELARQIILDYGWNATSYQILNPGMTLWFSAIHRAVIGYIERNGVYLVGGAPVCTWEALAPVCGEFEAFAHQRRRRVCFVCAEERLRLSLAHSTAHAKIALGAQPAWDPANWPAVLQRRPSLRAQLRRAANKDVEVEPVTADEAVADRELRRVLSEWLKSRRLPPLRFLVEPDVLNGVLADRLILVARRGGVPEAFLVASPMPARGGYLVELLARSFTAPNGTGELLIDAAMRRFAEQRCHYATLGLVALAHPADEEIRANPGWLRPLMYFARAHANRFYNFRGLEQFRMKMSPERWEIIYAISNERLFSPRTLYAIGSAFSGIPPWAAVGMGIAKALSDEVRNVLHYRSLPPARDGRA